MNPFPLLILGKGVIVKRTLGLLVGVGSALIMAGSAGAATLNVVGGQLLGASGIDVSGVLYDVEFLDGTCISLFDGCDSLADFTFTTATAALSAATALLDQVFLDGLSGNFDSDPTLTNGCTSFSLCQAVTPHGFLFDRPASARARNGIGVGNNNAVSNVVELESTFSSADVPSLVWAVWTPIPEPGTAVLMGLGLLGLGVRPSRRRRS